MNSITTNTYQPPQSQSDGQWYLQLILDENSESLKKLDTSTNKLTTSYTSGIQIRYTILYIYITYIHTLHYITYITYIHYIHTLHTLHYITLHYITLHYITLHTYIHLYIYTTYIYTVYICVCVTILIEMWPLCDSMSLVISALASTSSALTSHKVSSSWRRIRTCHRVHRRWRLRRLVVFCFPRMRNAKWKHHGQYQMSIIANSMIMIMMMMMINPLFPLPSVRIL